jgi:hypothetical protein
LKQIPLSGILVHPACTVGERSVGVSSIECSRVAQGVVGYTCQSV